MFKFSDPIDDNEFELYKNDLNSLLDKKKQFYAIFDLLEIKSFNINFFFKQMTYMYSKSHIVEKYLKGCVILVDNQYGSIINMALSLKKPIAPNFITSNLEDGIKFLVLL
jgi:hypothetical protein